LVVAVTFPATGAFEGAEVTAPTGAAEGMAVQGAAVRVPGFTQLVDTTVPVVPVEHVKPWIVTYDGDMFIVAATAATIDFRSAGVSPEHDPEYSCKLLRNDNTGELSKYCTNWQFCFTEVRIGFAKSTT